MRRITLSLLAAAVALVAGMLHAQTLSLFEPVEVAASPRPEPPRTAQPGASVPPFVLTGISQIGGKRRAHLRTPQGETLVVNINPIGDTALPGHSGYRLESAADRQLVLRHPPGVPCLELVHQGVRCEGEGISHLSLATVRAVQVPVAVQDRRVNVNGRRPIGRLMPADVSEAQAAALQEMLDQVERTGDGEEYSRRLAAALREARERGDVRFTVRRDAQGNTVMPAEPGRFQPYYIDPADLPPGTRIISTPFGERIVREE